MIVRSLALAVATCLGLGFSSSVAAPAQEMPALSICDLAKLPKKSGAQVFRIKAIYVTDFIEYSFFADRNCPGVIVALFDTPGERSQSLKNFDRALEADGFGIFQSRVFSVDFLASFHSDINEIPGGLGTAELRAGQGGAPWAGGVTITEVYRFKRHVGGKGKAGVPKVAF